jgi:hypothetical protein
LKAHGPRILRLLAFVVGCDYSGGGIRDIGMVKVLPVLFRYGDNTAAVLKGIISQGATQTALRLWIQGFVPWNPLSSR